MAVKLNRCIFVTNIYVAGVYSACLLQQLADGRPELEH
jgi:hypothetical protein